MLYYLKKIKILKIYKNIDWLKKSVFATDHDLLRISEISDSDLKYWSMKKKSLLILISRFLIIFRYLEYLWFN